MLLKTPKYLAVFSQERTGASLFEVDDSLGEIKRDNMPRQKADSKDVSSYQNIEVRVGISAPDALGQMNPLCCCHPILRRFCHFTAPLQPVSTSNRLLSSPAGKPGGIYEKLAIAGKVKWKRLAQLADVQLLGIKKAHFAGCKVQL
jgi:hypothetical protein